MQMGMDLPRQQYELPISHLNTHNEYAQGITSDSAHKHEDKNVGRNHQSRNRISQKYRTLYS